MRRLILSSIYLFLTGFVHIICVLSTNPNLDQLANWSAISGTLNPESGRLLKPLLTPRSPGSQGAERARQHIKTHFEKLGWHVEFQNFTANTPNGPISMVNIIANPPHSVNSEDGPQMTLCAHYDSKPEPEGFIGAIDSAVPCALILYLAELQASMESKFNVVFFDGEEAQVTWTEDDSLYGAKYYAEHRRIGLMVLLDLLGSYSDPVPPWFANTKPLHAELQTINEELHEKGLVKSKLFTTIRPNIYIVDDHTPFLAKGVPVLHLFPGSLPTQWHTMNDNAAHLNFDVIHDWAVILGFWLSRTNGITSSKSHKEL